MPSKWSFFFSLLTLGVLGAIVGLLVFMFTQRPVDFNADSPKTSSGLLVGSHGFNVTSLSNVTVANENYFPVLLKSVVGVGSHPLYNGTLGNGKFENVYIKPRSTMNFTFPFNFQYLRSGDKSRDYFNQVTSNCSSGLQLYVYVETVAQYSVYVTYGQINLPSRIVEANCPTF